MMALLLRVAVADGLALVALDARRTGCVRVSDEESERDSSAYTSQQRQRQQQQPPLTMRYGARYVLRVVCGCVR